MNVERVFIAASDSGNANLKIRQAIDTASWLWHPEVREGEQAFLLFRREFSSDGSPLVVHVSADERYELMLDGKRISRGPHRGDLNHWLYSSYRIELEAGRHEFTALVWVLGRDAAPAAQISLRGGFVFKAESPFYDAQLTTGAAPWLVSRAGGWKPLPVNVHRVFGIGAAFEWNGGAVAAEAERPAKVVRGPVVDTYYGAPVMGWMLAPSSLPDMFDREVLAGVPRASGHGRPDASFRFDGECLKPSVRMADWARLLKGETTLTIPADSEEFALIDLQDYYTGYPVVEVSSGEGSSVRLSWAEALYDELKPNVVKTNRDIIEGKLFNGIEDVFHADGGNRRMSVPWWRSGRYLLASVKTSSEALVIRKIAVDETGYPLEIQASFSADCPDLEDIAKICERSLRACSHETFMDCPYYEQLMYVGDTRLEMLTLDALCSDDRLIKRCIELFDDSRVNWGFVNERYPAWQTQHSPTFSLIWTLMLHDFLLWRNPEPEWMKSRLVGLRSMLEHFMPYVNGEGLLEKLPGWPFMDWTTEWKGGVPAGGYGGVSSSVNLLYAYVLQHAAMIEDIAGEAVLAARWREKATQAVKATMAKFWSEERRMLADDEAKTIFSEHAQALAILCGAVEGAQSEALLEKLLSEKGLVKASSYFIFYLFEAFKKMGRAELIQSRLDLWRGMLALGFKTTPEEPRAGTRSDCHAWSAQIMFHLYASVAGIRPASPGFKTVRIEPRIGSWTRMDAALPHPAGGYVKLSLRDGLCKVSLPEGISGSLLWNGREFQLEAGAKKELC